MLKKNILVLIFSLVFLSQLHAQETLTITTYYPSPNGSYHELGVNRLAVDVTPNTGVAQTTEYNAMNNGDAHIGRSLIVGSLRQPFWYRNGALPTDGIAVIEERMGIGVRNPINNVANLRLVLGDPVNPDINNSGFNANRVGNLMEVGVVTDGRERMRVRTNPANQVQGFAGINTTTPQLPLTIGNTALAAANRTGFDTTIINPGNRLALDIRTDNIAVNTQRMRIVTSPVVDVDEGLVGINTGARVQNRPLLVVGRTDGTRTHTAAFYDGLNGVGVGIGSVTIPPGGTNPGTYASIQAARENTAEDDNVDDLSLQRLAGQLYVGTALKSSENGQKYKMILRTADPGGISVGVNGAPAPAAADPIYAGKFLGNQFGIFAVGATRAATFRGDVFITNNGFIRGAAADVAEAMACPGCEAGDVVIIDADVSQQFKKSSRAYDYAVGGVISKKPTLYIGDPDKKDAKPLALVGQVECNVATENGPIKRGDLLVTSSKPGFAMRADIDKLKPGMMVGKALEPLEKGEGKIIILISAS